MNQTFPHGYALLIGVGASSFPAWSLPMTVYDARAIRETLTTPDLCAWPDDEAHIRLLSDGTATRQAMQEGLDWLAAQAAADPDATCLAFFSGHGWLDKESDRYYLVPHDVTPFDLAGSALAATDFIDRLRAVKARRLLVCIDSCHAQGMATAKEIPPLPVPSAFLPTALPKGLVDELKQGEGRAVFLSSRGSQKSWTRPDGTRSIFTHHLIEALHGAGNQPGDREVRLSNLMNHLGKAVPASAVAIGHEQTPFFDTATEDFPIALLAGGKGLAKAVDLDILAGQLPSGGTVHLSGDGAIAQGPGAVAAGKGGVAVGGDLHGDIRIGKG